MLGRVSLPPPSHGRSQERETGRRSEQLPGTIGADHVALRTGARVDGQGRTEPGQHREPEDLPLAESVDELAFVDEVDRSTPDHEQTGRRVGGLPQDDGVGRVGL